jgi:hypothetical protein
VGIPTTALFTTQLHRLKSITASNAKRIELPMLVSLCKVKEMESIRRPPSWQSINESARIQREDLVRSTSAETTKLDGRDFT